MEEIPLAVPTLSADDERWLVDCVRSGFVSSVGAFVEEFERALARQLGAAHVVACASGTAAIHLALRALGVGPGDRVLVSDCTFVASANPAAYLGAELAFVDSETASWNLDPALVEEALRRWAPVKAVIAVHLYGQPADLGPILEACRRHGAFLIEDAAEALGASYAADYPHPACRGRQAGTIGDIGCLSFNGNKVITTGGGGACIVADAALAARIRHLSTQAKLPGIGFVHDAIGYNYRMPNLNAALGLAQLARLPQFLERKRAIAARYRAWAAAHGYACQPTLPGTRSSEWLPSLLVPRRDAVLAALQARGIRARPVWTPLSAQPCHRGRPRFGGAVSDRLAAEGLSLPCSVGLSDEQQQRVIAVLEEACRCA
ncbi:MAG: aminotransferase class I/II-fold pyridoxal phosphate-dependent enzyme [Planctomycetota bacterium]|nr:aminotransferase class I/II-fold pyridoxal phosphate-dependent enzyme [Planctomycetota bacterium]MCX8040458.1 aminotransferase class I/II-fold pyridoxal phosphate-dependent enzyme [Planctomycetota bacterium]MDW8373206.1 aminotransferase class I/II-fold pyridoxal phosphate-dependent enzyme [Planctomycetota bacterium]